jgi:hypothetical protein
MFHYKPYSQESFKPLNIQYSKYRAILIVQYVWALASFELYNGGRILHLHFGVHFDIARKSAMDAVI